MVTIIQALDNDSFQFSLPDAAGGLDNLWKAHRTSISIGSVPDVKGTINLVIGINGHSITVTSDQAKSLYQSNIDELMSSITNVMELEIL